MQHFSDNLFEARSWRASVLDVRRAFEVERSPALADLVPLRKVALKLQFLGDFRVGCLRDPFARDLRGFSARRLAAHRRIGARRGDGVSGTRLAMIDASMH